MADGEGSPIRTVFLVGVIAVGAALLVSSSYELTRDRIAANARARLLASLESVLASRRARAFAAIRSRVSS